MTIQFNRQKLERLQNEITRQQASYNKLVQARNQVLRDIKKQQETLRIYSHDGVTIKQAEKEIKMLEAKKEDLNVRCREVEGQLERTGALLNNCLEWISSKGVHVDLN